MADSRNRPHVFLSHSKHDAAFIDRVHADLHGCQIEPWLDTADIWHGEPWQEAIFGGGIPECDCVLAYFTEKSMASEMVKREIDASLIQKLKDRHMGFLPYVSEESLRPQLRVDIQAFQVPVWNNENYSTTFPRVVSAIWHYYTARSVSAATSEERAARLAELELERLSQKMSGGIFTESEILDFDFIRAHLDRWCPLVYAVVRPAENRGTETVREYSFQATPLAIFVEMIRQGETDFSQRDVVRRLRLARPATVPSGDSEKHERLRLTFPAFQDDLLMYGLVHRVEYRERLNSTRLTRLDLTEKANRFRYWLVVQGLEPMSMAIQPQDAEATDVTGSADQVEK